MIFVRNGLLLTLHKIFPKMRITPDLFTFTKEIFKIFSVWTTAPFKNCKQIGKINCNTVKQIHRKLRIYSHLLIKLLTENFIFLHSAVIYFWRPSQ